MKEFSIAFCSFDYLVFKMLANLELEKGIKKKEFIFQVEKFHKMGTTNDIYIHTYIHTSIQKTKTIPPACSF